MAESHVVTALISKRAELAGLIEHHQKEMGRLAADLAHLDATLKLFSPEIDLRTIWTKAYRVRSRFFRPGECQRMVLDIFREAQGAALSSRQIGETLVVRQGLEATIVVTGIGGGAIAVQHFRLQEWAGSLGGVIFGCGLPGWAIVRWVFKLLEKNRDAAIGEVAKEVKEVR